MKKLTLFSDSKRIDILNLLEQKPRRFVELKKLLGIESNLLAYNLKILAKENLIEKKDNYFALTGGTKCIMPYIHKSNDASQLPLPCVAVIIRKKEKGKDKILIRTKTTEPGIGRKIFVGGKIDLGEDLFEACKRHVKEKVGIEVKDLKLICINSYVFKEQNTLSHFLVFFITAKPKSNSKPKDAKYYSKKGINGKLFPDNRFVLKNMLDNKKVKIAKTFYDADKDEFSVISQ